MKANKSSESLNLVDESKKLATPFPVGGLKYTGTYREDLKKILAKAREGNLIQGDSEIEKSQNLARESTQFKLQGLNFKLHSKLALDNFSQGKNGNKIYKYCRELLDAIENCKSEEDIIREFQAKTLVVDLKETSISMLTFFDQFCTANRDSKNPPDKTYSPFIFFKQALKKEIRLIAAQVLNVANPEKQKVTEGGKNLEAWSESKVPLYQQSLDEDLKFPREKFVEQVTKLADVGSLNITLTNPAVKIFKSKIPGIEITDTLSSDQIIALEGIDNAISKSTSQMGGYAKVLMATGGGKSHLTRIVEEEYKASGLVTDVLTIDLNNYDKDLGSFGSKFSEFKKTLINLFDDSDKTNLEKVLIQMDESYFYSLLIEKIQSEKKKTQTSSLTTSQSKKAIKITEAEIEKARNDVIRNLRKRGATIVTFGASESLAKMAVDITRLNDKIAEIGVKIEKMNKDKTIKAYREYIKNIRGHAGDDSADETKAGAVNNLHRYLSAAKSASSGDLSQARGWGLVDQDIKNKIKRDAKLISTFADDRDSEQKIFNEEERKKFKALKAALSSKEMKDIYLRVNDVLKDPRINKLLKDFYATQIEEENAKIVVLQQRLEVKKEQYADLQSRRDVETMERFDRATKDGRFVTKATDLEKDLHGQRLFKLVEGTLPDLSNVPTISVLDESGKETLVNRVGKMQYVLPDFEITDRSCTIDDLRQIQEASNADIIIIPFKEPGKDLQCKIYWKPQGETDFRLEIKSLAANKETDSEKEQNKHLSKIIAGGNHKILSFFDKKNAIGGDYGSAGVNITHQSILAKTSEKLTANKLMQCNRDRTAKILGDVKRLGSDGHFTPIEGNDPVERQFIIQEEISLEDLKSKIDSNTKQDDENHVVGYLRSKIDGLIGGIENKSLSEFEESNLLRYKEYLIKEPWKNFSSENDNKTQSDSLSESNSNSGLQATSSTPKKEVQNHVNDCNKLDEIAVEITKNVEIELVGDGVDKEYICIKDDGENPAVMIVYEGEFQKEYKIPFRYYIIDDEDIKLIKDKLSKAEEVFNSLKKKSENIKRIFNEIASDKKNFTVGDLTFSVDDLDGDGDDYAKVIISKNKNVHETRYLFSKGVFVVSNPENSESSNHKIEYKTSATIIDEILAHFEEMSKAIELSKTLEEKIKQVFNLQGDVANLYSGGGMLYEKISGDFGSHKGYSISEEGSDGQKSDIPKFDFDDGNIVKCNGEFQTSAQIEQRIAEVELFFKQESTKIAERKALLEEIVNLSDTLKGNEVVLSESGKKIVVELKSQESDGQTVNWYELTIFEKDNDSAKTKSDEEAYKIEKVYTINGVDIWEKTQDPDEALLNPKKWSEVREYLIAAVPVLTTELKKEAQSINKIFEGLVRRDRNSFENKDIKIIRESSGVVFEQKKAGGKSVTYSAKSELINKRFSSEPESPDEAIRTISELEDIKKNFSKILEQKKASEGLYKSLEDLFNARIGLTKDEIEKGEITAKCDITKQGKKIYTAFIDNEEGQPKEFTFTFTKGKLVEILQGTEAKADDVKLLETLNTAVVSKTNKAKALKLSAAQLQKTSILQNLNKTAKALLELKVADHKILKEVGIVDIEKMQLKSSQPLNLLEEFKITFQNTKDEGVKEVFLLRPDDFFKEGSKETYNLSDLIKKNNSLSELLAQKLKAVFDEIASEGKDGFDITDLSIPLPEKSDSKEREEFKKISNSIFSINSLPRFYYEYRFKEDGVCGVTFYSKAQDNNQEKKLNINEIAEDIKRFSRILNQKKTQIFAELKEDFLKILGEKDSYESKNKKFRISRDAESGIFTLAAGIGKTSITHKILLKDGVAPAIDDNQNPDLSNLSLVKSNLAAFQAQLHEEAAIAEENAALVQSRDLATKLEFLFAQGDRINVASGTANPIGREVDNVDDQIFYYTTDLISSANGNAAQRIRFKVKAGEITEVQDANDSNTPLLNNSEALTARNVDVGNKILEVTAQAEEAERLKAEEIELAAAIAQSGVLKGKLEDLFNAGVSAPSFESTQNNPTTKETATDGSGIITYTTTIKKDGLADKVLAFEINPAEDLIKVKVDGVDSANNSEALTAHNLEIDEQTIAVSALVARLQRAKIQADKMAATEGQHDNLRVDLERLFGEMEKLASVDSNAKSVISKEADDDKITYKTILKSLVDGSDQELTFTFQGNDVVEVASGGRIYPSTASSLADFSSQIANKMSKIEEQMKLLKRAEAVSTIQRNLPKLKFRKDARKAISAKNEQYLKNLNSNFVELFAEEQALLENSFELESSPTTFQEFPADATNPARRIFTTKIEKGGVTEEIQFIYSSEDVTDADSNVTKKESRVVKKVADGSIASPQELEQYDAAIAKILEDAKNASVKKAAATKIQAQGRGLLAKNIAQKLRNEALITTLKNNLVSLAAQEEAFVAQGGTLKTSKTTALVSQDSTSYRTTINEKESQEEIVLTVTKAGEISLVKKGSDKILSPDEIGQYSTIIINRLKLVRDAIASKAGAGASHNSASVTGKSKFADLVHKYFDVKKFALENLEKIQKNNAFDNKLDRAAKKVLKDDFSNLTTLDKITLANFYNETKKPSKPITKESLDDQRSDSYLLMEESIKELAETRFKDVESRVADKKSYSKSVYKALDETVSKYPSEEVKDAFAEALKDKILGLTNEKRK